MGRKISKDTFVKTKELINFIYSETSKEGGFTGSFKGLGHRAEVLQKIMKRKGIIITTGYGKTINYKWDSKYMAPTDYFCITMEKEILNAERDKKKQRKERIEQMKAAKAEKMEKLEQTKSDHTKGIPTVEYAKYHVLEYNAVEKNGMFRFNPIRFEENRPKTIYEVGEKEYVPIAIIPNNGQEPYVKALRTAQTLVGKNYDGQAIKKVMSEILPDKCLWKGLDIDFNSLLEDRPEDVAEKKEEKKDGLDRFTAQELWDELKRRGYAIEEQRLVQVRKEYLE